MNGIQCTRRIRKFEAEHGIGFNRRLPVIAVTANAREEQRIKAYDAGVDAILAKPFTIQELMVKISEVIP
jgi:CheY-like chemotaxis protein